MEKRRRLFFALFLCTMGMIILAILLGGCILWKSYHAENQKESVQNTMEATDGTEGGSAGQNGQSEPTPEPVFTATPEPVATPTPIPTPTPEPVPREGLNDLKLQLENQISGWAGTWSVYVCDLQAEEYLSLNSAPMKAASLIKLYIMGAVYEAIEEGSLEETQEIDSLLNQMITVSHNESSNELVRRLSPTGIHEDGMPVVNEFASQWGFTDTSQGRDLQDFREVPPPGENYTSVNDCGHFLEMVYKKECVSAEVSEKMTALLRAQTRTWKIPAGLPQGVGYANKTGELSDVENDVAIVYGAEAGAKDYVICVMTGNLTDVGTAQQNIQTLSGIVYEYFRAAASAGR